MTGHSEDQPGQKAVRTGQNTGTQAGTLSRAHALLRRDVPFVPGDTKDGTRDTSPGHSAEHQSRLTPVLSARQDATRSESDANDALALGIGDDFPEPHMESEASFDEDLSGVEKGVVASEIVFGLCVFGALVVLAIRGFSA